MIRIKEVGIKGTTKHGTFTGALHLSAGLNVFSAKNAYGKSLAATAIPWCLGVEPIFGVLDNDPSRFPGAVRDTIDIGGERDVPVLSSEAFLSLQRADGAELELRRPIVGGSPEIVQVLETTPSGSSRSSRMYARKRTMQDVTAGLQHFLFDWLKLPRTRIMSNRGVPSEIYLENIAPLFFIDQNEGWTDIQSLQVYRYGQQEIAEASIEFILGATESLTQRFQRQQGVSQEAKLKNEAEALSARVHALFRSRGWTIPWSSHGSPREIAKRWGEKTLSELARSRLNMDGEAEQRSLESRILDLRNTLASAPLDALDLTVASKSSQSAIDLKTRRHELRIKLREIRTQLADQQSLLASIEHRIQSSADVLRLKSNNIGRIELIDCPTCGRRLDPATFNLSIHSETDVSTHIEALKKERLLITSNIAVLESRLPELTYTLDRTEGQLRDADRTLDTVNNAVGAVREKLAKTATDLAQAERALDAHIVFRNDLASIEASIQKWTQDAQSSIEESSSVNDHRERVDSFTSHLQEQLAFLGHSAVQMRTGRGPAAQAATPAQVRLDDHYIPYIKERRLRSLGSASDHARLVAAYVVALAESALSTGGHHPGFVVLDEPLQQNPDSEHHTLMLRFLSTAASAVKTQLIVLTSIEDDEIKELTDSGVNAIALRGEHFLEYISDREEKTNNGARRPKG